MADNEREKFQAARTETSPYMFFKDLADFLKAHQEVLPSLPELCDRFAEIECKRTTGTELQTPDTSRSEELTVLDKRKPADLKKQFDLEMTVKRERITSLERESKGKDEEVELIKKQNEELKKKIKENEEKIEEYSKRDAALKRELEEMKKEKQSIGQQELEDHRLKWLEWEAAHWH